MTRTSVHVVRHGEVENPNGILYGRLPGYVLSERGHAMAEMVAQALAPEDITLVVASPLQRAQQTAEPIARAHGLPVMTDERLIEADNVFEGQRLAGASARDLLSPGYLKHFYQPLRPSWESPTPNSGTGWWRRSPPHGRRRRVTRRFWSPTNPRSGRCDATSRANRCGMILAAGSVRLRPSRR